MTAEATSGDRANWLRLGTLEAERHFREGNYEACRRVIGQLQSAGIDTPLARVGLALLDFIDGKFDETVKNLRRAEELGPVSARVWEIIGRLHLRLRRIADGVRALDRAIVLEPELSSAHDARGIAHLLSREPEAAERAVRESLRLGSQSFEARYHLGLALERQQRVGEAMEAYKAAIAASPSGAAPAHRRLADLFERDGQGAFAVHHRALSQRAAGSKRPMALDIEWFRQGLTM